MRDGEMVQQLRGHTLLVKDLSSVLSTHFGQLACNYSFRGIHHGHLHSRACTHTHTETFTCEQK